MPVYRYLDVSTAHITGGDRQLLERAEGRVDSVLTVLDNRYGWLVFVPEDDHRDDLLSHGFSVAFCDLLAYARRRRCHLINLDCDADREPTLPMFVW